MHPETKKPVAPVELCPILKTLYKILIKRFGCSWTITAKEFFGYNYHFMMTVGLLILFCFPTAENLRQIQSSRQYEMNRCMIHGKELRWHSASLCTDHLFSVDLKVMPRLRLETLFLCSAVVAVSLLEVLMQTCMLVFNIKVCVPKCVFYVHYPIWIQLLYLACQDFLLFGPNLVQYVYPVHTTSRDSNLFVVRDENKDGFCCKRFWL
jgi:hypothetical protein